MYKRQTLENDKDPEIRQPEILLKDECENDITKKLIWTKCAEEFIKRTHILQQNQDAVHSTIWGQCTDVTRAKLESATNFATIKTDNNVSTVTKAIKQITFEFKDQQCIPASSFRVKQTFHILHQHPDMDNVSCMEKNMNTTKRVEGCGGLIGDNCVLMKTDEHCQALMDPTLLQHDTTKKIAKNVV